MKRSVFIPLFFLLASIFSPGALAQSNAPTAAIAPAPVPPAAATPAPATAPAKEDEEEPVVTPSWETQRLARTYSLQVPAPRGQITDREGRPLAQTRLSYNLAIEFPSPPDMRDSAALDFARKHIETARTLVSRKITISDEAILKHYRNRGILPLDIANDLPPADVEAVKKRDLPHLLLRPIYERFYPNGPVAGHMIGYAGRSGRTPDGPVENNDLLWPTSEGREGLEQTFNDQLKGSNGQMNISFDAQGRKTSEKIVIPPQPGYNVITTLDVNIQRLAEQVLDKGARRGALVIVDPNNGDILAMASTPRYDPNAFVPSISPEAFKALQDDPNVPLLPRAYRSAYPPGSIFKVVVGLAALETATIDEHDEFSCPGAMQIGNMTFRNWKKSHAGMLDFAGALVQSCDTWFYQVGIKLGAQPVIDWATKMGFGTKTGIPLAGEAEGRIPTDEFMKKVHGRKFLEGDLANFSIGQGDVLTSPLQFAQAMGAVANGGMLYRARLVQQVQSVESQIITAYETGVRENLRIDPKHYAELKKGLVGVVYDRLGTGGRAAVDGIRVAGKTGTAQWGPKKRERYAAWFAGFAPADNPKYAFSVIYESNVGEESAHGGTVAAPMIGKVLKELFKEEIAENRKPKKRSPRRPSTPPAPAGEDGNSSAPRPQPPRGQSD